jgi:hypothetical protein
METMFEIILSRSFSIVLSNLKSVIFSHLSLSQLETRMGGPARGSWKPLPFFSLTKPFPASISSQNNRDFHAALSRNLDFLTNDDTNIPVLTVHQAKGLEFDTVFVAGMTEDEFPSYYAKQARNLEEEKRLFYVAITRAKRHLVLSSYKTNDWGHDKPPSAFLTSIL